MKQKILFLFSLLTLSGIAVYAQTLPAGVVLPDNIVDACSVTPPSQNWSISPSRTSNFILSPYQNVVAGDIDGDGIVELITCGNPVEGGVGINSRNATQIVIYKGNNLEAAPTIFETRQPYSWDALTRYAIIRTTINSQDTAIIVVAERDRYLRAYNHRGDLFWESDHVYHPDAFNGMTPTFADLNGDGIPEIIVTNRVFDSTTGGYLCQAGANQTSGTRSTPIVDDIFQTGQPHLIMGNSIYRPNSPLTGFTLVGTVTPTVNTNDPDYSSTLPAITGGGRAAVVDMDLDGRSDVVVSLALGTDHAFIYIYDPDTRTVKASKIIPSANISSYPFIGDIDGDGRPEIVFIKSLFGNADSRYMFAYKYEPGNPILQEFWRYRHADDSGQTAMTLFDFNQDGISEIVYRDETHLRIIDGSLRIQPTPYNLTEYACSSGTSSEYPIVADVDGDGQAEIVIVGGTNRQIDSYWLGYLWVFRSGDPVNSPWAPARPVWNQYAYNSLNVNKDLSIPRIPMSPSTRFAGNDGILGNADDVRPFNNFLQQQTALDQHGTPLWLAPNAIIVGKPEFVYNDATDAMTVTVTVENTGDADFQSPFFVTVYKNNIGNATRYTYRYNNEIEKGKKVTLTFSISAFSSWTPYNVVILRLNDNGNGQLDQPVCDPSSTDFRYYGILSTGQAVCLGNATTLTCSYFIGGYANTYQWQSSTNGFNWDVIPGATTSTYTPPDKKRGTTYYRVVVSGGNEVIMSEIVKVRIKSCRIPVNHNISVMEYE